MHNVALNQTKFGPLWAAEKHVVFKTRLVWHLVNLVANAKQVSVILVFRTIRFVCPYLGLYITLGEGFSSWTQIKFPF